MGFLERIREIYRKSVRTNPIFSANLTRRQKRGIPRREKMEMLGVEGESKEETLARIDDVELVALVWRFRRKGGT